MFKKKILSTLLAVGLSATFLVGCGAEEMIQLQVQTK